MPGRSRPRAAAACAALLAGLAAAGLGASLAAAPAAPREGALAAQAPLQPPVFGVESESVEVDVLVTRGGRPVADLGAADFEVRDQGRPQPAEVIGAGGYAVHAVLVLDRSESMAGTKLDEVKAAARALLSGLTARDRATVVVFDYVLELLAGPAAAREAALDALAGVRAGGSTALHDAVYAGLKLADARAGRPILLVFSDGVDRLSWLGAERVLATARGEPAAVYAVIADEPPEPGQRDRLGGPAAPYPFLKYAPTKIRGASTAQTFLEDLVRETGGRLWHSAVGPALRRAFLEVLEDARSRYVLRFEPTDTSPGWHRLEVRLKGVKGDVRARRGYHRAPPPHAGG